MADARLSAPAAVGLAVANIGCVLLILFAWCGDRYPLGDWNHACRPCVCDDNGALLHCDVPGVIDVWVLHLKNMDITRIKPGAFEGNERLIYLEMHRNSIAVLEPGSVRRACALYMCLIYLFN